MDVTSVDPRDIRWEEDVRAFRAHFWRRLPPEPGIPPEHMGHECDSYELTGGDVAEALAWAEANRGPDRTFTLYARLERPEMGGPGQVWLFGDDPTAA